MNKFYFAFFWIYLFILCAHAHEIITYLLGSEYLTVYDAIESIVWIIISICFIAYSVHKLNQERNYTV